MSFCFHARVVAAALERILGRSGQSGVYTTHKSEHSNFADPRYSIVWTPHASASEACAQADTIDFALGIVRSAKDKPSYGIRAPAKHFEDLWQLIRPAEPKPKQVNGDYLYRISPVPEGATHEDVTKWITLEKLQARPLRAINSNTWIIVGEAELQRSHLTWQQNAILVQPIESRYCKTQSTILAGKKPDSSVRRTWKSEQKSDQGVDPLTIHDPWAKASMQWSDWDWASRSSAHSACSSSSSKASTSTSQQETHAKQQREIDRAQSKIETLETAIHNQRKDNSNFRKEVQTEFQQVRKEVTDRVSEVKDAFQSTLTEALTQTQSALRSSFREDFEQLKALLAR